MLLHVVQLISILFSAIVGGMYWGPWLAVSRSLNQFDPATLLAVVRRLNENMASLMTALVPVSLLSIVPVLFLSFGVQSLTFYATLAGFICFVIALIVTVRTEVPIVMQMITWDADSLPANWRELRDRWMQFHIVRVVSGVAGLILLLVGALF